MTVPHTERYLGVSMLTVSSERMEEAIASVHQLLIDTTEAVEADSASTRDRVYTLGLAFVPCTQPVDAEADRV